MRKLHFLRTLAVALPLVLLNLSCILVPKLEDRNVELAVGASTSTIFDAKGSINTYQDTKTVDVHADIDLSKVLDDNGVKAEDVKDIKLVGVSYRIVVPEGGRSITGGTLTIQRSGGAVTPLVTSFTADCSTADGWVTVPLDAAGVGVINTLIGDLLTEVKTGTPATNTSITYHVAGNSVPSGTATNFSWEFKLDLTMIGTVKVQVLN
jgi:hypothetical protein